MKKEEIINEILEREWNFFTNVNNVGGRASCQDNKIEFIIMRKSQWETLPEEILESYLEDLREAERKKINIVVEKYARMMEFSSPIEYEVIKHQLYEISQNKKEIADKIVKIYLNWEQEVMDKYPKISKCGRPLYSTADTLEVTSIETFKSAFCCPIAVLTSFSFSLRSKSSLNWRRPVFIFKLSSSPRYLRTKEET